MVEGMMGELTGSAKQLQANIGMAGSATTAVAEVPTGPAKRGNIKWWHRNPTEVGGEMELAIVYAARMAMLTSLHEMAPKGNQSEVGRSDSLVQSKHRGGRWAAERSEFEEQNGGVGDGLQQVPVGGGRLDWSFKFHRQQRCAHRKRVEHMQRVSVVCHRVPNNCCSRLVLPLYSKRNSTAVGRLPLALYTITFLKKIKGKEILYTTENSNID
jgi:hypothetical protein